MRLRELSEHGIHGPENQDTRHTRKEGRHAKLFVACTAMSLLPHPLWCLHVFDWRPRQFNCVSNSPPHHHLVFTDRIVICVDTAARD